MPPKAGISKRFDLGTFGLDFGLWAWAHVGLCGARFLVTSVPWGAAGTAEGNSEFLYKVSGLE
jgi:hypothetical protein